MSPYCACPNPTTKPKSSRLLWSFPDTPAQLANLLAIELVPYILQEILQLFCLLASHRQLLRSTDGQGKRAQVLHIKLIPQPHRYRRMALDDKLFITSPIIRSNLNPVIGENLCCSSIVSNTGIFLSMLIIRDPLRSFSLSSRACLYIWKNAVASRTARRRVQRAQPSRPFVTSMIVSFSLIKGRVLPYLSMT